jgi:hypothetical protein
MRRLARTPFWNGDAAAVASAVPAKTCEKTVISPLAESSVATNDVSHYAPRVLLRVVFVFFVISWLHLSYPNAPPGTSAAYSIRTMRSETLVKRAKTAASWPGTSSRVSLASERIRSCVRRFEAGSSVWAIGAWASRFS